MLRIGLLGAARITPKAVIEPARRTAGVEVTAIAARDSARASAFAAEHGIANIARSYEDLLRRDDVDMVYVALPTAFHAQWCLAAIEAGKHVFCEKPFSMSQAESQSVVDAAAGAGLRVIEATHNRYHPLIDRIRTLVQRGAIGKVRSLEAWFETHVRLQAGEFRREAALGGGAFRDLGHYCVHLARTALACDPDSATCVDVVWEKPGVDEFLHVSMPFGDGIPVTLGAGMQHHRPQRADAIIMGDGGEIRVRNFLAPQWGSALTIVDAQGRAQTEDVDTRATFDCQMEALVASMQTGAPLPTEGKDIVMQSRALDLAYAAAALAS